MAQNIVINKATGTGSAPADTILPPVNPGVVDQANAVISVLNQDFIAVEVMLEGSSGDVSAEIRAYSWTGTGWARRGDDADTMDLLVTYNDDIADRRLLFRLDVRDTPAIAFVVYAISGTGAAVTVSGGGAGKGY